MKNKKLKQLIAAIMVTTTIGTAIPSVINTTPVYAVDMTATEATKAKFTFSKIKGDTEYEITRYTDSTSTSITSITIPDKIDGINVTSIGSNAFEDCNWLTYISIPSGVSSIGNYAFYCCSGLTYISIPSGVSSIGDCAFYGCSGLTFISIPSGISSIGNYVLGNCSGLTSISIPSGVTSIGTDAFTNCSANAIFYLPNESVASLVAPYLTGSKTMVKSILTLDSNTYTTANFSFPAQLGAASVKIQQSTDGGTTWTDAVTTAALSSASTSATVKDLLANTSYKFRLLLNGNYGGSALSGTTNSVSLTEISARTYNSVDVTFPAQTGATSVKIQQSTDEGTNWIDSVTSEVLTSASTSATVRDLSPNTSYKFRLLLNGNYGGSALSETTNSVSLTGISAIANIDAAKGTAKSSLNLPSTLDVNLQDSSTRNLGVTWDNGISVSDGVSAYNGNIAGTYTFAGTFNLPPNIINPLNLKATVNVIVGVPVVIPPVPPSSDTDNETTPAAVKIEGTEKVGNTLSAELLDKDGKVTTGSAVTYEWYRLDASDSSFNK